MARAVHERVGLPIQCSAVLTMTDLEKIELAIRCAAEKVRQFRGAMGNDMQAHNVLELIADEIAEAERLRERSRNFEPLLATSNQSNG